MVKVLRLVDENGTETYIARCGKAIRGYNFYQFLNLVCQPHTAEYVVIPVRADCIEDDDDELFEIFDCLTDWELDKDIEEHFDRLWNEFYEL